MSDVTELLMTRFTSPMMICDELFWMSQPGVFGFWNNKEAMPITQDFTRKSCVSVTLPTFCEYMKKRKEIASTCIGDRIRSISPHWYSRPFSKILQNYCVKQKSPGLRKCNTNVDAPKKKKHAPKKKKSRCKLVCIFVVRALTVKKNDLHETRILGLHETV